MGTRRRLVPLLAFTSLLISTNHAGATAAFEGQGPTAAAACAAAAFGEKGGSREEQDAGDHAALLQTQLSVQPSLAQVHRQGARTKGVDTLRWLSAAAEAHLGALQTRLNSFAARIVPSVMRWKNRHMLEIEHEKQEELQIHDRDPNVLTPSWIGDATTIQKIEAKDDQVLLVCGLLLAACVFMLWWRRNAYWDAIVGAVSFGLSLFLVASWNAQSAYPMMLLWGKFIIIGMVGLVIVASSLEGAKEYERDYALARSWSSWQRGMYLIMPGVTHAAFELLASMSYLADVDSSGVNSAIICTDPILVAIFFYWWGDETLSACQLLGMLLTVGGAVMIGMLSGTTSDSGLLAVVFAFASMTSIGACVIANRLATTAGLSDNMCSASRCVVMGICGLLLMFVDAFNVDMIFDWKFPGWVMIAAAVDCTGIYAMCRAYSDPGVLTAVLAAIVGCCCLVNLGLGIVILGTEQPMLKYVSMGATFLGVVVLAVVK